MKTIHAKFDEVRKRRKKDSGRRYAYKKRAKLIDARKKRNVRTEYK